MGQNAQGDAQTLVGGEDPGGGGTLTEVSTHQGPRTSQCPLLTEQKGGGTPSPPGTPILLSVVHGWWSRAWLAGGEGGAWDGRCACDDGTMVCANRSRVPWQLPPSRPGPAQHQILPQGAQQRLLRESARKAGRSV